MPDRHGAVVEAGGQEAQVHLALDDLVHDGADGVLHQGDLDVGVFGVENREDLGKHNGSPAGGDAHGKGAADLVGDHADLGVGLPAQVDDLFGHVEVDVARRGGVPAVFSPGEELGAQTLLQLGDGLAQGAGGDKEPLGGPEQAALLRQGQNVLQLTCIHRTSHPSDLDYVIP